MSKGSLFWSTASGKLGETVFYRAKGEQRNRTYVKQVANPRTPAQIAQRMKLYAPISLYKSSIATQFVYAYEDQRTRETQFNAFMRHNLALSPWTPKTLASEYASIPFPAKMSVGSTPGVFAVIGDFKREASEEPPTTWAVSLALTGLDQGSVSEVSTAILTAYPQLREGDMLTFVAVRTLGLSVEAGDVLFNGVDTYAFMYCQIVLDTTNSANISSLGFTLGWGPDEEAGAPTRFGLIAGDAPFNQSGAVFGGCIIVSRKVDGKVIASTSQLVLNDFGMEVYNLMRTTAYRDKAALTYNVGETALLDPGKEDV